LYSDKQITKENGYRQGHQVNEKEEEKEEKDNQEAKDRTDI